MKRFCCDTHLSAQKDSTEVVLTAVGLILAIFTVILLITCPCHGDASSTWAGKVVGWALGFSHNTWKDREKRENCKELWLPSYYLCVYYMGEHVR